MNLTCTVRRLADEDLPRIGRMIGVGEDELHAFLDVEASGSGYDHQNRLKALYEPHRAYALAAGAKRDRLVAQGLAYPNWGEKPYPADSYPLIIACMAIDEDVAIGATSWGIAQIMGSNYVAAGYNTRHAMLQAFLDLGEAEQLEAAVRFIKANHLDDELRAHNWAAFARGYNGPKYAKNAYDTKLAAAFKKWQGIRDTPYAPPVEKTLRDALNAPAVTPATAPKPRPVAPPAPPPPVKGFWSRIADNLRTSFPPKE